MSATQAEQRRRLFEVTLDQASIGRGDRDQEQERATAVYDLVEENSFAVRERDEGPYSLRIALQDSRLAFEVRTAAQESVAAFGFSLTPFRSLLKDYFRLCESYYVAIRTAGPGQIEAIDRSRRALHDEGAQMIAERLTGRVEIDGATARRLFTLLCALRWKA